jgi:hypothetical protein
MTSQWARQRDGTEASYDLTGFRIDIWDMVPTESGDKPIAYTIDRNTIVKGLHRTFRDGYKFVLAQTVGVSNDPDEWDLDAIGADCIVQYGLFGEVLYG